MTLVAYSNAGTPTLAEIDETEDEPDKGSAKLRFFNTAASDSGAIDAYLIDQRRLVRRPRRRATAVATAVSDLQATFIDINPSGATPYRLCVTAAGDRTDVRLDADLARRRPRDRHRDPLPHPRRRAAERRRDGAGGRRDPGGQHLGPGAPRGGRRHRHGDGVVRHGDDSTVLGIAVSAPTVGSYQLVPTGTRAFWSHRATATSSLPPNTIAAAPTTPCWCRRADAARRPRRCSPTTTRCSTNTAKPVKMRLVNGANGARPARSIALLTRRHRLHRRHRVRRHRLALRPDRGERLDRDQGRDHRRQHHPLHRPRDLERDAHRLLGLRPGRPAGEPRSGPASFAPTADRKLGGVIPGFHCPVRGSRGVTYNRASSIEPPCGSRPGDPPGSGTC